MSRSRRRRLALGTLAAALAACVSVPAGLAFTSHGGDNGGNPWRWPGAVVLSIDVDQWGGGWVRSSPYMIDCPWACVRAFDPGTTVVLSTKPTPGFEFQGWANEDGSGPCAEPSPTADACTVTLAKDTNIRVLYRKAPATT